MTEQEIEQDRNCHDDLQSLNSVICGCCPHPRVTAVAKKEATVAPLALSLDRARDLGGQGEGSGNGHGDVTKKIADSPPVSRLWVSNLQSAGILREARGE
jgi:hypothetical protein